MSVKRRDLVRYLEQHGFYLLREGANHAIYTNYVDVHGAMPSDRDRMLAAIESAVSGKRGPCTGPSNPRAELRSLQPGMASTKFGAQQPSSTLSLR